MLFHKCSMNFRRRKKYKKIFLYIVFSCRFHPCYRDPLTHSLKLCFFNILFVIHSQDFTNYPTSPDHSVLGFNNKLNRYIYIIYIKKKGYGVNVKETTTNSPCSNLLLAQVVMMNLHYIPKNTIWKQTICLTFL